MHTKITHPKDIEYFTEYEAPLMELIHSAHFININSTIAFYGPMLYFFARSLEAHKILEIGHAECYTAWYLANAVKDNGTRYSVTNGQYYGIDIVQTELAKERLKGLPVTILGMDSMTLSKDTFPNETFDIIFQDGCHDEEHVRYELDTMYPQLRGEGKGYWIMHDIYGPSEEAFNHMIPDLTTKYNFEWCRLWSASYGLAILRKMDGYDPNIRYWRD